MNRVTLSLISIATIFGVVSTQAQTDVSAEEAPARLIVDAPAPDLLAQGIVWIPWRVENVRMGPVFGPDALKASPRVGHLHIHVDDVPWLWADFSNNPIDVAFLPPGPHQIRVELVNAMHQPVPGQSRTMKFTIPAGAAPAP